MRSLSCRPRTAARVLLRAELQVEDRSPSGATHRGTRAARLYLPISLLCSTYIGQNRMDDVRIRLLERGDAASQPLNQ